MRNTRCMRGSMVLHPGVCVNRAAIVDTREGSLPTGGNQRIMAEGLYPWMGSDQKTGWRKSKALRCSLWCPDPIECIYIYYKYICVHCMYYVYTLRYSKMACLKVDHFVRWFTRNFHLVRGFPLCLVPSNQVTAWFFPCSSPDPFTSRIPQSINYRIFEMWQSTAESGWWCHLRNSVCALLLGVISGFGFSSHFSESWCCFPNSVNPRCIALVD